MKLSMNTWQKYRMPYGKRTRKCETKSARGFNDTVQALENKYSEVSKPMCDFISWLKCAWAPIINEIVSECQ